MNHSLLDVTDLQVAYAGGIQALSGVSIQVGSGEAVALVGSNGAGKTTLLKAISGLAPVTRGEIAFGGESITRLDSHLRARRGIGVVPEGRRLFSRLSVSENLVLGCYGNRDAAYRERRMEAVFGLFPILRARAGQRAGTLSGGEQQMVAIGRALVNEPRILILDEPSLGLMPRMVDEILDTLRRLHRDENLTLLLVEQNVPAALTLCNRAYVLQTGRVVLEGESAELMNSDLVRRAFLGI